MGKVLVVYHSLGGNTKKMAEAVAEGARSVAGAEVTVKTGLEATIDDLLACDAVALGSPDYFSYMAGGLKDFLDRTYYPSQEKVAGKPAAAFGSAGGPPDNILKVLDQALRWFKLKKVADSVGSSGGVSAGALTACRDLGRKLAEAAVAG
ncbi:MAG: NAD(P)H-dependent oxidoreductase [Armatimonadota bacterium]|nr:MAG: NAD(P)H-dependent oxidoreductase [Armatimonadota bacterium]